MYKCYILFFSGGKSPVMDKPKKPQRPGSGTLVPAAPASMSIT